MTRIASTRRHARTTAVAVAVAAAFTTLSPLGAGTAAAEEPLPPALTVPAERQVAPDAGSLQLAGATGFLRGSYEGGFTWVPYGGGDAVRWDQQGANVVHATGSDTIARYYTTARKVVLQDVHGGTEQTVAIPAGRNFLHMLGTTLITDERKDGRVVAIHALSVENGEVKDRLLGGLPEGTTQVVAFGVRGEAGFFVQYQVAGAWTVGYVDTSFTVKPTPFKATGAVSTLKLLGSHLYAADSTATTAQLWDVADWSKPAHEFPKPAGTPLGVVGGELLYSRAESGSQTSREIVARRLSDGAERVLLGGALPGPRVAGPDGRLLFVRADGATERTVHSVKAEADGTAATAKLYDVPLAASRTRRIAAAQGVLHTVDDVPYRTARVRSTELSVSGALTAGPRVDRGEHSYAFYAGCQEPFWCPELVPTGDGRVVFEEINGSGLYVLEEGKQLPAKHFPDVKINGDLEASGRYASYKGSDGRHEVVNLDTGQIVFRRDLGGRPTSLDGDRLWVQSATRNGVIDAIDVRTGKTVVQKDYYFPCDLTDLQVRNQLAYWKCAERDGLRALNNSAGWDLPDHRSALLGENFVVLEQDGVLKRYDGASPAVELGRPADVKPGNGWTVDRFAGTVAYVDASGDTRVTRIPTTLPVRRLDSDAPVSSVVMTGGKASWSARAWVSKPVTTSSLSVVHAASGRIVRTVEGGPARGVVTLTWDGKDAAGRPAPDGVYTWGMGAQGADGTAKYGIASGTFTLGGAQPSARDHSGPSTYPDAKDDLLALTSGGSLDVWFGTGTGRVSGKLAGPGWGTTLNAAVPFGDVNGDNCKDVLVRMSSGELRVYKPGCGKALTPSVPYTKAGSGFGGMNVLTSAGDLTRDGRADLVTRNGDALYLYAGKAGGTLASGVRIGSGWGVFTHLAGTGDLDGDRIGDLVARKGDGSLYRYSGAGAGKFKAAVKIASGWGGTYNSVVGVGDLDSDAKRDLVARTRTGLLFRISGDGKGGFGAPVQIGSGWGSFKGLY
ncbi:FG-GAP-like repeat-containing protein [Streptomyces sp. NPDC048604]|uniref:FG-GAP-like repeat-containing protein n=1 Tax=Streptomyces sp. NPDC048604 TaxID=3365578 RepID=UPI003719E37A